MKLCHICDRHLAFSEDSCPFCGAVLRSTSAPRPTFAVGMGLAMTLLGAGCAPSVNPQPTDTGLAEDTGDDEDTTPAPTGPSVTGVDDDDNAEETTLNDTVGEGSTYAGPDETDTWATDGDTETDTESSTTLLDDSTTWEGEGSTYAGPDESTSTSWGGTSGG